MACVSKLVEAKVLFLLANIQLTTVGVNLYAVKWSWLTLLKK